MAQKCRVNFNAHVHVTSACLEMSTECSVNLWRKANEVKVQPVSNLRLAGLRGAAKGAEKGESPRRKPLLRTRIEDEGKADGKGARERERERERRREDVRNKRWLFRQRECLPNDVKRHGQALLDAAPAIARYTSLKTREKSSWNILRNGDEFSRVSADVKNKDASGVEI